MTSTVTAATGGGRIMKTDGGPHPADFWAQVTAEQICPIDEKMTGERRYCVCGSNLARVEFSILASNHRLSDGQRDVCAPVSNSTRRRWKR
jgi:hypothetical protein